MLDYLFRSFTCQENRNRHQGGRDENNEPGCFYFRALSPETKNQEGYAKWNTDHGNVIKDEVEMRGTHALESLHLVEIRAHQTSILMR